MSPKLLPSPLIPWPTLLIRSPFPPSVVPRKLRPPLQAATLVCSRLQWCSSSLCLPLNVPIFPLVIPPRPPPKPRTRCPVPPECRAPQSPLTILRHLRQIPLPLPNGIRFTVPHLVTRLRTPPRRRLLVPLINLPSPVTTLCPPLRPVRLLSCVLVPSPPCVLKNPPYVLRNLP